MTKRVAKGAQKCRPLRNLLIVSIAFLLNFSAYASLEMVQSSLNSKVGVMSLSACYGSLVVSSLVLPPLIIDKLGYRKSMGLGALSYAVYTAANFYPRPYTLIPAGLIVGAGASVLWASQRVYLTNLGLHSVGKSDKKGEKKIGYYFGIFHSLYSLSAMGNIIMSILLMSTTGEDKVLSTTQRNDVYNVTAIPVGNFTSSVTAAITTDNTTCGVAASLHWEPEPRDEDENATSGVSLTMLYILLSIYLSFSGLAALLLFFAIDEVPEYRPDDLPAKGEITDKESDVETKLTQEIAENSTEQVGIAKVQLLSTRPKSSKALLLATMRLTWNSSQLQLIVPSTVHFGILHTLMSTHFMKFWVTCSLGIGYVGYIALTFGVMSSATAYVIGHLLRWFRRITLFACSCLLEVGCLVAIMMWSPTKGANERLLPLGRMPIFRLYCTKMHKPDGFQCILPA